MHYLFSQFARSKTWLLLPACACMFSLLADDADKTAPTPACPATEQTQPSSSNPVAINDNSSDQANKDGCQCEPNTKPMDNKIADLGDEDPNDPTQPPRTVAAANSAPQTANAATNTAQPSTMTATITENKESGTWVTLDNGMTFEVPIVLRKKSINWQVGDKIVLEKGKRDNWYKVTNSTRKDSLRARLMRQLPKSL